MTHALASTIIVAILIGNMFWTVLYYQVPAFNDPARIGSKIMLAILGVDFVATLLIAALVP